MFGESGKDDTAAEPAWMLFTGMVSSESEIVVLTGPYADGHGQQGGKAVDALGEALTRKGWPGFVESKLTRQWSLVGRHDELESDQPGKPRDTRNRLALQVSFWGGKKPARDPVGASGGEPPAGSDPAEGDPPPGSNSGRGR